jgi:hypothetical protein
MALYEIDADLKTAEQTLNHWYATFPSVIRKEADAKVAYEAAWADAIKMIVDNVPEGGKMPTVAVIEAEATQKCIKEITEKRNAEAEAEIAKKLIGIAETTLTSIQTRAGLARMELGLAG